MEGESHRPENCIQLGKCVVRNLPPDLPAGTRVEVEYRYGGNGCVSVSARVPSVRQSAHVEIERELTRNLEDLATWKARLCGLVPPSSTTFAPAAEAVDPADRASVVKRLDSLCMKVGQAAVSLKVSEGIEPSRRSAAAAATELKRSQQALMHGREAAAGGRQHVGHHPFRRGLVAGPGGAAPGPGEERLRPRHARPRVRPRGVRPAASGARPG